MTILEHIITNPNDNLYSLDDVARLVFPGLIRNQQYTPRGIIDAMRRVKKQYSHEENPQDSTSAQQYASRVY